MASHRIVDTLQQAAIFQGLRPPQLAELARHVERIKFAPGEFITRAGEAGTGALLLVSGAAERVPDPDQQEQPEAVHPGSLIGQLAMLIEHAYGSTIVARERVFCLKVTRLALGAQMAADPTLAEHLERHVTQRLHDVAQQLRAIDSLLQARRPTVAKPTLALRPPQAEAAAGGGSAASG